MRPINPSEQLPLTQSQSAMWIQWKFAETSPAYNNPLLFELRGELQVERLQRAFAALVDWHEVLRMRFVERDGIPFQYLVHREGEALAVHDLSGLDEATRETQTHVLLDRALRAPFDLLRDLPYRFNLLKLGEHRFLLTVNVHHICADGVSAFNLLEEIARDYNRGHGEPLPATGTRPDGFLEYLKYEAREWSGEAGEKARAFWQQQLSGSRLTVDFSGIHHPAARGGAEGAERWHWTLGAEDFAAVKQFARQTHSTLFIVLAAALKVLLRRYTGQDEINLAYPVDIRPPGFRKVSGCLINYLPLNTRLSSVQSVADLIEAIKQVRRNSKPFEGYPHLEIARIVREGNTTRERKVFNIAITRANFALAGLRLDGLETRVHPVFSGDAKEDLGLLFDAQDELHLAFEYRRSVLADEAVREMASEFNHLLRQMVGDPSRDLGALALAADQVHALRFSSMTPPERGELSTLLSDKLQALSQAVLVEGTGEAWTGARLDALADTVAHLLERRGVARGDRVGVRLSRSPLLWPALLGIWRVGACYVPIDPELPPERKDYIIEDAGLKLLLVDEGPRPDAPSSLDCPLSLAALDASPGRAATCPISPDDVAYVLYTSGSTGKPKGVEVMHRNAVSFLLGIQERLAMGPGDRLLAVTTIGFDISILELLLPLVAGATSIMCPASQVRDIFALKSLLTSARINHLQSTPSFFRMLLAGGWEGKRDLRALCGGEPLDVGTCRFLLENCREVWNLYGPTETTVWSMVTRLEDATNIHLGEPLRGTTIHLLDPQGRPVPRYTKGELFIGGQGVARGYRNRPELTRERFVTTPTGERLYRTGDLAWRSARDELHFLGREDGQVKIRGYRIELGEVEHQLEKLDGVRKAVVLPVTSQVGEHSLSAWVELERGQEFEPGTLRAALSRFLPPYMIPTSFEHVERWPLNASGKIDRKALKPTLSVQGAAPERSAPVGSSPLFSRLEALYRDVLGATSLDPAANIFELGGQSLTAARIVSRLHQEFAVALPLNEFMEHSSLGELERLLTSKGVQARSAPDSAPPVVPGGCAELVSERFTPSSNEKAMFFINHTAQCREAYNIPIALRMSGGLDVARLDAAVREVIGRHAQLRANFTQTAGGIQKDIRPPPSDAVVQTHPRTKSRDLRALLTPRVHRRFDLSRELLLSVDVFPLEEGDDVVLYVFHHILLDGLSCGHFLNEVGQTYQRLGGGPVSAAPAVPVQPLGALQEKPADSNRLSRMIEEFGLRDRTLALPYSAPFPELRTLNGGCHEVRLPQAQRTSLETLSREQGLPVSVLLLAAYSLALHHASRDEVVNVGLATLNRTPETFSRLGLFTNTVVLPVGVERGESVRDFLHRVATSLFAVYQYADVPFQDVVGRLVAHPGLGVTPLFQAFYNFMDRGMYDFSMGDLRVEEVPFRPAGSKFELSLEVHDLKTQALLCFEYSSDVLDSATVEALADLVRRIALAMPRSLDRSIERLLLSVR